MDNTYWLAICENGKASFGKITLGEFRERSKCIRIITDLETTLGDFGCLYEPGQGAIVNSSAFYETEKAALLYLRGLAEKHIEKREQELGDARAQERKLRELFIDSL